MALKKLSAPEDFCIIPGDRSGLSSWLPVAGADGYMLDIYRSDRPDRRLERIYAQKPRKNIHGLENGVEYFGILYAYYMYKGEESLSFPTKQFFFVPISYSLSVPKTICLSVGETQTIEWDYKNEVPDLIFSAKDNSIVAVTQDGEVTGYKEGHTTVTATLDVRTYAVIDVYVERELKREFTRETTLMFTGDLMCPPRTQRMCSDAGYDFSGIFSEELHDILSSADYTAGVLKTVCDDSSPYSSEEDRLPGGSSNLNSPSTFLYTLKDSGFNGLFTATRHNSDCGLQGMISTRSHVIHAGLNHIGALGDNPVIRMINGLKVAFISLTQLDNHLDNDVAEAPGETIGRYSDTYLENSINIARKKNADFIIVMMNWGNKNTNLVTLKQSITATSIAEAGADFILGTGPHVVQAYEELKTSDGRVVPCLYSLGNMYSGMDEVYGNSVGIVTKLCIQEDSESISCKLSLIPVLTYKQDGLPVTKLIEPVVSSAQKRAYDYIHEIYPPMLFEGPDLLNVSLQGSYILEKLAPMLDCRCDYFAPDINHLLEKRGEFIILDMINFIGWDNSKELVSVYTDQIARLYRSERIILFRMSFPDTGISEGSLVAVEDFNDINHDLYDMEELVIEKLHPIVIDICSYYFCDLSCADHPELEDRFYRHAARVTQAIIQGRSHRFYYDDQDADLWLDGVIAYHDDIRNIPHINRMMLNTYEAADLLADFRGTAFIKEHYRQFLKLKQFHVELPYVKDFLGDTYENIALLRAVEELQAELDS